MCVLAFPPTSTPAVGGIFVSLAAEISTEPLSNILHDGMMSISASSSIRSVLTISFLLGMMVTTDDTTGVEDAAGGGLPLPPIPMADVFRLLSLRSWKRLMIND